MAVKVKKCVIISGAPEKDLSYYGENLDNSYVICADSGYKKCIEYGAKPHLIVGDFDSSDYPDVDCEIIRLNCRKDDTDTFHCVKYAVENGYEDITVLGGIGSRLDHTYSNILSILYCFENNVKARLVNTNTCVTVEEGSVEITKGKYKYFSFFALFDKCTGVTVEGAEYNLNKADVLPTDQFTQSNELLQERVEINIEKGKILLILSND